FGDWPLPQSVLRPGPDESPSIDYYLNAFTMYPGRDDIQLMLVTVYDRSIDQTTVRLATSRDGLVWHWVPGGPVIEPGVQGSWDGSCGFANLGLAPTSDGRLISLYSG